MNLTCISLILVSFMDFVQKIHSGSIKSLTRTVSGKLISPHPPGHAVFLMNWVTLVSGHS